jgi:beta-N-acetylhexosaminidase
MRKPLATFRNPPSAICNRLAVLACLLAPAAGVAFAPEAADWAFADARLSEMTVAAKIGQLIQIGCNARFLNQDSAAFQELAQHVRGNQVGGLLFYAGPVYATVHLANRLQELAAVPLLVALDAETGVGMRFADTENFPWSMAVAATGNPDFARRIGEATGREARALGIHQVYAPVLDVNNNAANPVINVRSFSEDPATVARFGNAFIAGVQSQRVLATAKHFPGHGDTHVDSHRGLPVIDIDVDRLHALELVPFQAAIEAGVASMMIAHISLPQIDPLPIRPVAGALRVDAEAGAEIIELEATRPATLSPVVVTDLLRDQLGFTGLIVTDSLGMSGLTLYVDQAEAGVQALLAGADVLVKPADTEAMLRGLHAAVASGRVPLARLDASVRRILAWKHALGLFADRITPLDPIDRSVGGAASRALADAVATHAVTLVRNDAGLLPLEPSARVFILGLSNGSEGDLLLRPLTAFLAANGIDHSAVMLPFEPTATQVAEARRRAAAADVVIAGLYGRVRSGARDSIGLPAAGVALLRELIADAKPVVAISFGNPYVLAAFPALPTYIVAYGGMPSLQLAALRATFGQQDFHGRLPITLPGLHPRGTGLRLPTPQP